MTSCHFLILYDLQTKRLSLLYRTNLFMHFTNVLNQQLLPYLPYGLHLLQLLPIFLILNHSILVYMTKARNLLDWSLGIYSGYIIPEFTINIMHIRKANSI